MTGRDSIHVKQIVVTPEKMARAFRNAAENAKRRVKWVDRRRDMKLDANMGLTNCGEYMATPSGTHYIADLEAENVKLRGLIEERVKEWDRPSCRCTECSDRLVERMRAALAKPATGGEGE